MLEDAYTIMRELYEKDPLYREDFAIMALNFGTFYYEAYRLKETLRYLRKALEHRDVPPM
ncbi:hypothetical protein Asulf_01344 [Archaeoglobus sulfaticallidus PM70-1]|uniref:Tetratricopeptide repeat protein n=1 Tax=Archaeoglobus sulfaticallidus PM70-1 TaxID=387631 RepID=N0BM42_9EURY|nr:hypothetical protein [Archaeoglobus sulfaticallidus]AGK61335.1 hypothetical protein Asulf_01344 [Archaeoglobus sulfaticallidus PM70-1]